MHDSTSCFHTLHYICEFYISPYVTFGYGQDVRKEDFKREIIVHSDSCAAKAVNMQQYSLRLKQIGVKPKWDGKVKMWLKHFRCWQDVTVRMNWRCSELSPSESNSGSLVGQGKYTYIPSTSKHNWFCGKPVRDHVLVTALLVKACA